MAQKLQSISIEAAGFAGINTQDSPTSIDPSFAAKANNCVIDQFGRIGSRKGSVLLTETYGSAGTNTTHLLTEEVDSIFEFTAYDGTTTVLYAGNQNTAVPNSKSIFKNEINPIDIVPASYLVTQNNWKMASLSNKAYFFQKNHEPLIWDGSGDLEQLNGSSHSNGTPPQANEVIAAYGKLWAADIEGDKQTLYWSDTLIGGHWSGGSSGSLNLTTVFPNGYDEIVALSAHNGFLIIFCRNCIIIYEGAETPNDTAFKLSDIVEGVGCIERDSVQHTGTDIIFLSADGLRTFGRTIQEKSMPIGNLSKNVRNDLMADVKRHAGPIKSVYSSEEAFYLLALPDEDITYCFDMRGLLPDNSARVTTWSGIDPRCLLRRTNGDLLFGKKSGIYKYTGYNDSSRNPTDSVINITLPVLSTYTMTYESNPMNFGQPANLKFLKKIEASVAGNVGEQSIFKWHYDYNPNTEKTFAITPAALEPNAGEFNIGEFTAAVGETGYVGTEFVSGIYIQTPHAHGSGNGRVLSIGIDAQINGSIYSIQRIDTQVLLGRTI